MKYLKLESPAALAIALLLCACAAPPATRAVAQASQMTSHSRIAARPPVDRLNYARCYEIRKAVTDKVVRKRAEWAESVALREDPATELVERLASEHGVGERVLTYVYSYGFREGEPRFVEMGGLLGDRPLYLEIEGGSRDPRQTGRVAPVALTDSQRESVSLALQELATYDYRTGREEIAADIDLLSSLNPARRIQWYVEIISASRYPQLFATSGNEAFSAQRLAEHERQLASAIDRLEAAFTAE
jgi:hypothetical protein